MIFRCDCVWVREGGVLRERYTDICAWCVCVCVCVCICERRTNVCGHVRNLSGMCISQ